jgi:hypothetical protein
LALWMAGSRPLAKAACCNIYSMFFERGTGAFGLGGRGVVGGASDMWRHIYA